MSMKDLKGHNEATPLLDEFNRRQRLAELGYTLPLGKLCAFKADVFVLISSEMDRVRKEMNKPKPR